MSAETRPTSTAVRHVPAGKLPAQPVQLYDFSMQQPWVKKAFLLYGMSIAISYMTSLLSIMDLTIE